MTDDELRALMAALAGSQMKTDEQIAELRNAQKQTDEQIAELRNAQKQTDEQIAELRNAQKQTDEQIAELRNAQKQTDEQQRKTDEQMKRTDEQIKRTDEKLERIGIHLGNITDNQGAVAEEFFYNSLKENPHLGPIHFDDVAKNEQKCRSNTEEEYDIVMTNGHAVGIVEVKYKAHENDLQKLERKMRNFKKLYPWFEHHQLYGAIASFHIYKEAKAAALGKGFFVLQRSGNIIHTDCADQLLIL